MARKVVTYIEMTDDFDGCPAEETVELAIDGMVYELDLSSVRAKEIRELLHPYQEVAHDKWRQPPRPKKKPKSTVAQALTEVPKPRDSASYAAKMNDRKARVTIRAWAEANGRPTARTGKIATETLQAFMEANPDAYVPETTLSEAGLA